jgi:hypothetical protein
MVMTKPCIPIPVTFNDDVTKRLTGDELSAKYGVSRSLITTWKNKLGLCRPTSGLAVPDNFLDLTYAGKSINKLAAHYGYCTMTIDRFRRELGLKGFDSRRRTIDPADFVEKSKTMTTSELRSYYHVSFDTISKLRRQLGITTRMKPKKKEKNNQ